MGEILEIVKLGHAGDGVAADGTFVPYAVPGDRVRIARDGTRGRIEDIIVSGPSRTDAPCRHFGRCGGCALQMMAREPYLAWKRDSVVSALNQRGFADPPVEEIRAVGPGTRRRASLKARGSKDGVSLGFYEPGSRNLVDLAECPVLVPALVRLIPALRAKLRILLKADEGAELLVTETGTGIDLSLSLKRAHSADLLMSLAELAAELKLARLTWNGETVAMTVPPSLAIGKFTVELPAEPFLQPTEEGERILQSLARENIDGAKRVADLFSGCGTFALALADSCAVHAADSAAPQIDALRAAAKAGRANVSAETRDLFRRPLLPSELVRFDAVVLDPPRPGAQAQAKTLAQSATSRIIYVSCNPASFARDARILCDGGYALSRVVPLDQFVWSPHVELFGLFIRP